jgi:hypothetical protein
MDIECPHCEETFGSAAWNESTEEEYGTGITKLEDEDAYEAAFVCPNCRALVEYHEFGEEADNA